MNYNTYLRVGNKEQLENENAKGKNIFNKIYELEELSKNKLNRLDIKIQNIDAKVAIYINDENYTGKTKSESKIEKVRKFCKKAKIGNFKEYIDCSLVNNYHKKDLRKLISDAVNGKFNTVVVLNSNDIGENKSINTYIINEAFTKNNIRFIDIEQRVDTNFDETIIMYENPIFTSLMNFIDSEEKKMKSERIKKSREIKC